MNHGALTAGVPAVLGTITAAGTGANEWNVLWENGTLAVDVHENGLYDFSGAAGCTFRPARRKTATGVYPAPDTVGMIIAQDAAGFVIRTIHGYQYWVLVNQIQYYDEQ